MFRHNARLRKQRPSSPPEKALLPSCFGRGGDVLGREERRLLPSRFQERWAACPGPHPGLRPRTCWRARARARGSRMGAARLRMGGEEECTQTGDSNPGCKGYSPSMHFFWGGDMPIILLPSIFGGAERGARACWPARVGARLGGSGRTRWLA